MAELIAIRATDRPTLSSAAAPSPRGEGSEAAPARPARRRRSARLFRALRRWRTALVALCVASGSGFFAWKGMPELPEIAGLADPLFSASASAGLAVDQILVSGRRYVAPDSIMASLGIERGDPILAVDPKAARTALLALPWVIDASVERQLPGTILVRLTESRPMALWQSQSRVRLIDQDGRVLAEDGLDAYSDLPLVVGADAPEAAADLIRMLGRHPSLSDRVTAAIRVGGRRWDLLLSGGLAIRLPEDDVATALDRLERADRDHRLLSRDLAAIDMRLPDRMVLQTTASGAERMNLPEENT